MIHLRVSVRKDLAEDVMRTLEAEPSVSSLARIRDASVRPAGDLILADVAREAANGLIETLHELGTAEEGTIHIEDAEAWLSRPGLAAAREAPGSGADAVVWADVTLRSYRDSELNGTFTAFITLATMIAGIAIVLDSQILVIGAMVIGPEFAPIAALGVALVRRRRQLFTLASRTLLFGFLTAIALTTLAALGGRALGWVTEAQVLADRPATDFIYTPDKWSFIVAVIAACAGVLSLTSSRVGGLSGVFISVTTVPAAGNIALGIAFGIESEIVGSTAQLLVNISAMTLAGWATLALQQAIWSRVAARRKRKLHPS